LGWLLKQFKDGLALTQTGNLNRNFVQGAASRFGWDFPTPPRTEDDLFGLHLLRLLAQRLGLARRSGRKLVLTSKGRDLLAEGEKLWRVTARGLLGSNDFSVYAGELFLALVIDNDSIPYDDVKATVAKAAREEGFRDTRSGEPPEDHQVGWAIADTSGPFRALGLVSTGGDWFDRDFELSDVGKATALEALRARATGPRTLPY
jgi:hypothetical protein